MTTKNFGKGVDKMTECPCCGVGEMPPILEIILEHLKDYFNGRAVTITSCCRCPDYNARVGGSKNSAHLIRSITGVCDDFCLAADVYVDGIHPMQVYEYLDRLPYSHYLSLGYYEPTEDSTGFTHIDVRGCLLGGSKPPARWEG